MTTTMSEHTATLLDSFCRSWLLDREAGAIPPVAVAVPVGLFDMTAAEPTPEAPAAPLKPRRKPLPRTITLRPSKVRAMDGRTAYEYRSNEYITIAQRRFPAVEIEANPVRIWLTENEAREVSAIASWRGQTAGRTKHRTIPSTGPKDTLNPKDTP